MVASDVAHDGEAEARAAGLRRVKRLEQLFRIGVAETRATIGDLDLAGIFGWSLPFAPDIVMPAIEHMVHDLDLKLGNRYGFKATFNPTYPEKNGNPNGWISPWHYGLNQGPICSMIENHRSDLVWRLMLGCPYIVTGLRRAGFDGGWLASRGP